MKKLFLLLFLINFLFAKLYTIHLITENSPEILAEYLVHYKKDYKKFYILQYGPSLYGLYAYKDNNKTKLKQKLDSFIPYFPSAIIEETNQYNLKNYKINIEPFIHKAKLKNYKKIKTIYIPFKLGKYTLTKEAKKKLKSLVENNDSKVLIFISTQADSIPIRYAKAKDNMDLSVKRAKVIKKYILKVKNEK